MNMKRSHKLLLVGLISIAVMSLSGELFDALGIAFGPGQALASWIAGILAGFKLFSGH